MDNELHLTYDEEKATEFIRKYVPLELNNKLSDDDIDYIINKVYSYYEESGMFDDNSDETTIINIDEEELISYVVQITQKEKTTSYFTSEEISFIIQAELAYCDSIGIFE